MGWTLFYMVVILKIPMAAALYIVWYAIKQEPAPDEDTGGGQRRPRPQPPRRPLPPRRPAGGADCRPLPCPQLSPVRPASETVASLPSLVGRPHCL
jgi:hypothetical protein